MVNYFYSVVIGLLDCYMPVVRTTVDNVNKPWVTKTFRNLVKQRQRAFLASQTSLYRKLRNKVNRMSVSLRSKYFTRKIETLHSADGGGKRQNNFFIQNTLIHFRICNKKIAISHLQMK